MTELITPSKETDDLIVLLVDVEGLWPELEGLERGLVNGIGLLVKTKVSLKLAD